MAVDMLKQISIWWPWFRSGFNLAYRTAEFNSSNGNAPNDAVDECVF